MCQEKEAEEAEAKKEVRRDDHMCEDEREMWARSPSLCL
jgi:hypothetical protein